MGCCTGGSKELRRQLEDNPDWEHDLLALYDFDIWDAIDGRLPVRRAASYIQRLIYEPKSVWRAKQLGGPELKDHIRYFGWDANSDILADVFDAINGNTRTIMSIVSQDQSKVPDIDPYPRPGVEEVKAPEPPKQSLADFGSQLRMMFAAGNLGG